MHDETIRVRVRVGDSESRVQGPGSEVERMYTLHYSTVNNEACLEVLNNQSISRSQENISIGLSRAILVKYFLYSFSNF